MPVYSAHENCVLAALVAEMVANLYYDVTSTLLRGEMPAAEPGSVLICTSHEKALGDDFIIKVNPKDRSPDDPMFPHFGKTAATVLVLNMHRAVAIDELSDEFIIELAAWHRVLFPGSRLRAKKRYLSWRQLRSEEKSAVVKS